MKLRIDQYLVNKGLVPTRHQAQVLVELGRVKVNGRVAVKASFLVETTAKVVVDNDQIYLSRGAYKLASVAPKLALNFRDKIVLDVGASTGGFTDFALKNGAAKIYAVDVGTGQLDPHLVANERVINMPKTDIRIVEQLPTPADMAVMDLSFISARAVLEHVAGLIKADGQIVVMVKPQFEVGEQKSKLLHNGVVKNDTIRRRILTDFETWARERFKIVTKADSGVPGAKGNLERFYLLELLKR